ncbi:MAG: hypothetical protein HG447_009250 [Prevotella sp.]|nr:hypothetical protein [Prevotella sp.]
MIEDKEQYLQRRHRGEDNEKEDRFRITRQWLNIIFMIGAIAGVIVYLTQPNQNLGTIIVLVAMFFKIIECALRFIR